MSSDNASSQLKDCDPRPHLNLVFIGHVDAGKSTTCGNIMYLSGSSSKEDAPHEVYGGGIRLGGQSDY